MGFRYYRRVNLGKGLGLNLSKSGVSPSVRTKWGSVGTRNYSIPIGIKGLYYRGSTGGKNAGIGWLIILLLGSVFILAYYLIVGIIKGIGFLWNWIVKGDHIEYVNLIIFLTLVLGILIAVYFSIPIKSAIAK